MLLRFISKPKEMTSYRRAHVPTLRTTTPLRVVHATAMPAAAVVTGGPVVVGTGWNLTTAVPGAGGGGPTGCTVHVIILVVLVVIAGTIGGADDGCAAAGVLGLRANTAMPVVVARALSPGLVMRRPQDGVAG
jgi:hypothetical protein